MLTALLALLQEGHQAAGEAATSAAGEHATEAVEQATEAAGPHAEPWLVEQANQLLGPAGLKIEQAIMPPIYHLFGKTWHAPQMDKVIPEHVVWAVLAFIIAVGLVLFLRGKLSVDRPS